MKCKRNEIEFTHNMHISNKDRFEGYFTMIKSFFFIPGNHRNLAKKLVQIESDFIIIDLEDAIFENEVDAAIENLSRISNLNRYFVRLRVFDNGIFEDKVIKKVANLGVRRFVIPKFRTLQEFQLVEKYLVSLLEVEIILLVETAQGMNSIEQILTQTKLNVLGIGFGSQDYCSETGIEHTNENLKIPRYLLLNMARAHDVMAIDIACMAIRDNSKFMSELSQSKSLGYDGKFIIHPDQLSLLKNFHYYGEKEISEAIDVIDTYEKLDKPAIFLHKGKTIEPPHLRHFAKIIKWADSRNND